MVPINTNIEIVQQEGVTMFMNRAIRSSINGLVIALPTVVFLLANDLTSLRSALLWTVLTAVSTFGFHLVRREPVRPAIAGLSIAVVCVTIALVSGQAKAFFLLPAILPAVIALLCLVTIFIRRPIAGLVLNRMAGGPPQWWKQIELRRVYSRASWVCFGVDALSAVLQRLFYAANKTIWLGIIHISTPPIFSVIVGVTVFYARRQITNLNPATQTKGVQQ
jgi:hypothetical protein